jgi:5-methylcytosine-specific restriction endonuclease McrA
MASARARFRGEYVADRKDVHNRVRAEAGNRCIRCGHPEGDTFATRMPCDDRCTHPADGKMRILTVHHLTGEKSDNRWWNLLALCQSCHLTIQGRVIPERPWLFEHTAWFKPYVAGFYASYYGGENLTRAEVEANLDRYLTLGQPWRNAVIA